jgi:hypothetical protein
MESSQVPTIVNAPRFASVNALRSWGTSSRNSSRLFAACNQDDDSDVERGDVLLIREIAICGHEDVEFTRR